MYRIYEHVCVFVCVQVSLCLMLGQFCYCCDRCRHLRVSVSSSRLPSCEDIASSCIYFSADNKQSIRAARAAHHQLLIMLMMMMVVLEVTAAVDDADGDAVAGDRSSPFHAVPFRSVPFEVAAFSPTCLLECYNKSLWGIFFGCSCWWCWCLLAAHCTTFDSF